MSWLRVVWALITTTPSAVMRWSRSASRRSLTASGSDDARMSKRRCTALDTLLTFCPPAPCARTAVSSTSDSSIGERHGRGGSGKDHRGSTGAAPRQSTTGTRAASAHISS